MKSLFYSTVLVIGLAGCAAAPDLPSTYLLEASQPEGLAIVSLTLTGRPMDRGVEFRYEIRELAPPGEDFAIVRPLYASLRQHAFAVQSQGVEQRLTRQIIVKGPNATETLDILSNGLPTGRLATMRLPLGDYEIYSWELRESSPTGVVEYVPPRVFSYRFSVRPGVISYIGRLNLHMGARNAQHVALEDRRADDLELLRKKYPALPHGLVSFTTGNTPP